MAEVKITDEASLETWLKTRPRRDAEIIAFRAAARVFPLWGRAMEEEWAVNYKFTTLLILRMMIQHWNENPAMLALAGKLPPKPFRSLLIAKEYGPDIPIIAPIDAHSELPLSLVEVFNEINQSATKTIRLILEIVESIDFIGDWDSISDFDSAGESERLLTWLNVNEDAQYFEHKARGFRFPLWHNYAPDWFTTADLETRAIWAKDPDTWRFWEKWWDGVISGDMPYPPDLLRDVALIEDDIWQAGPKAVAAAIEKIEKIHDLRAQLDALTQAMEDEDLSQAQRGATLVHRGHNNPPEIIEAYEIVQSSAVDIAKALEDAREELAKPAPEPSRLQAIGNWMLSAIMNAVGYCGGLTDKFLQSYAGTLGEEAAKWTIRLISGGVLLSMLKAFAASLGVWP